MTRINLLPPERIKKKRIPGERSYLWLVIMLPLILLLVMGLWWFSLGAQVSQKEKDLEMFKEELTEWQNKTKQLEPYKKRQEEIVQIENVIVNTLKDRIYWARILNNIAIMCPGDIWLTSLTCSEQAVSFSGFALQCPNRDATYGAYPYYPDYRPIAGWLDRMAQIGEFESVWLSSASPSFEGATGSIDPGAETREPATERVWYEDGDYMGSSDTGAFVTPMGVSTRFVGKWVIQFDSEATLDAQAAKVTADGEAGGGGEE